MGIDFNINHLSYKKLKKRIKKNEGFSPKPYKDQLGFLTIGFGHFVLPSEQHLLKKKLSKKELENIFFSDFNIALRDFNTLLKPFVSNIKDSELLIEMVFQIGISGVIKFKKLLYHMNKGNRHLVSFEMMNSLWYTQTPKRVKNLITTFLKK